MPIKTTPNKIAEREKLQKAEYKATHFPVPPKIEDLPKFRRNFEQAFGKQKAEVMMNKLEEMSRAFRYNGVPLSGCKKPFGFPVKHFS